MFLFQKDLVALLRKKVNLLLCKKKRKLFFFSLSHFSLGQPNSPSLPLFIFSRSAQSVPRPSSLSGPTASLHSLSPTCGAHLSGSSPTSSASLPPFPSAARPLCLPHGSSSRARSPPSPPPAAFNARETPPHYSHFPLPLVTAAPPSRSLMADHRAPSLSLPASPLPSLPFKWRTRALPLLLSELQHLAPPTSSTSQLRHTRARARRRSAALPPFLANQAPPELRLEVSKVATSFPLSFSLSCARDCSSERRQLASPP